MAQINWLTPSGSIGTIAEKEYFEFQFDAYDSGGGPVNFVVIAGKLAQGFILSIRQSGISLLFHYLEK